MTQVDRWLLPDGLEEILPETAHHIENLRRELLDLFQSWGYELVIPPLIEHVDSLLIGLGSDMDLHSFKMVDQLSGRLLAVRPDITPQVARIDAHSLRREGLARLCYAGSVLHTKPKSLLASRSPIQIGAELYGEANIAADIEVIKLMLATLDVAGLQHVTLDLGHVGIFNALAQAADLNDQQQNDIFAALQRKAKDDVAALVQQAVADEKLADAFVQLANMHGGVEVLAQAKTCFEFLGEEVVSALDELQHIADNVAGVDCYIDLAELRGYRYHSGLVFAAYTPGYGQAIANGGRYDDIGEEFGRARPATGFSLELKALATHGEALKQTKPRVFASADIDAEIVKNFRSNGEIIICGMPGQTKPADCNAELVEENGQWQIKNF